MINSTNEQQAAAKCFQNQEKLFLNDVKVSGRLVGLERRRYRYKYNIKSRLPNDYFV